MSDVSNKESSPPQLPSAALVTGGSRGIGRAIAETLAGQGYHVLLTYVSKGDEAEGVASAIRAGGGTATAHALNVAESREVSSFFLDTIKDKVRLSVLVNNAGITKDSFMVRMKDDDFDSVIAVNLRGAFNCLREAAKIMSKQRHGRVINITSIIGQIGNAAQVNYSAAKAGLIGLTKSAAKELAGRTITVNAVAPGFIETDMTRSLPEEIRNQYLQHIPLGRFGGTQEVADAVAFLASDKAAYITGQVLAVNGGMYC